MNIKGKVIEILELQSGVSKSGKEWQKSGFVIEETKDQFPQKIAFTIFGEDKINSIVPDIEKAISLDLEVDVYFNLSSREYNDKWYHNIDAWKVDLEEREEDEEPDIMPPPREKQKVKKEDENSAPNDLPF